jgi:ketosteroid isomerase-like protein
MKTSPLLTLAVPCLLIAAGCAQSARENSEMSARADLWETAFNARDMDAVLDLYTEDARLLPPNAPMGMGKDAVEGVFEEMAAAGLMVETHVIETLAAGDLAYNIGTYALTADGAEVDRGKYMEIWRRTDGEWKMSADMFNSDLPAAGAAEGQTLVVTHEVEDAERWLAAWRGEDGRRALFVANGAPTVRTFQSPEDPNVTGLVITVTDMDALAALLNSPEGAAAKKEDGVKDETMRMLGEVE